MTQVGARVSQSRHANVNAIGQDRAAAPHFIHLSAKP
jgi:hypothetical protein